MKKPQAVTSAQATCLPAARTLSNNDDLIRNLRCATGSSAARFRSWPPLNVRLVLQVASCWQSSAVAHIRYCLTDGADRNEGRKGDKVTDLTAAVQNVINVK